MLIQRPRFCFSCLYPCCAGLWIDAASTGSSPVLASSNIHPKLFLVPRIQLLTSFFDLLEFLFFFLGWWEDGLHLLATVSGVPTDPVWFAMCVYLSALGGKSYDMDTEGVATLLFK